MRELFTFGSTNNMNDAAGNREVGHARYRFSVTDVHVASWACRVSMIASRFHCPLRLSSIWCRTNFHFCQREYGQGHAQSQSIVSLPSRPRHWCRTWLQANLCPWNRVCGTFPRSAVCNHQGCEWGGARSWSFQTEDRLQDDFPERLFGSPRWFRKHLCRTHRPTLNSSAMHTCKVAATVDRGNWDGVCVALLVRFLCHIGRRLWNMCLAC